MLAHSLTVLKWLTKQTLYACDLIYFTAGFPLEFSGSGGCWCGVWKLLPPEVCGLHLHCVLLVVHIRYRRTELVQEKKLLQEVFISIRIKYMYTQRFL